MNEKYYSIGGLTIKIESQYQYPSPQNVSVFETNVVDDIDLHVCVLSNKLFLHDLGKQEYIDDNWFSTYKTRKGERVFIFFPDDICNITHVWINASMKKAEIFIAEEFLSDKNISIIETTPFLMLFMTVLVKYDGFILHSAGISINEKGYIFCGKSGSGKTTISNLFKKITKAKLLTDESLLLRRQSGDIYMYGTPWKGSSDNIYSNTRVQVEKIYFIFHGKENKSSEIDKHDAISILVQQAFPYFWDKTLMLKSFSLMTAITNCICCSNLHFLPDVSVVSYVMQHDGMVETEHNNVNLYVWYTMKKKYLDFDPKNSLEIKVLSDSMMPTFRTNDWVRIKSAIFNHVQIGSIIAFLHFEDHVTVHRVISITKLKGEIYYRTKGDANLHKDYYLVPECEVIGVVVY